MRAFLALLLLIAACSSDSAPAKTKHALVIGIDGVRVDVLLETETPRIDSLTASGAVSYDAFAGGELGGTTEQPTFSGPGWSTILTGVWADKHGVLTNAFDDARFDEYPHFFSRVREQKPDAYLSSFVTWGPINESILASAVADEAFWPDLPGDSAESDRRVTAAVVEHLASETPDVVFVHLDEVDHQGHLVGFGLEHSEYVDALRTVDGQIGEMIDALAARPTLAEEDWLVLVTTDHGGLQRSHGGQSDEERRIFLSVSPGVPADTSGIAPEVVSPGPGQDAVPPTVMGHLDLAIDPAWGWEGEAFGPAD